MYNIKLERFRSSCYIIQHRSSLLIALHSQCCTPLDPIQLAIYADRAGPSCIWCPACFVCDVCNEALVDLHYFYKVRYNQPAAFLFVTAF